MKTINLTQGQVALVDDEDYEYLNQWKWCAHKDGNTYYAERSQRHNGKDVFYKMHRVIMNTEKGMVVDHKDHNGLNNQKDNLRNCTHSENSKNRLSKTGSASKYLGVSLETKNQIYISRVTGLAKKYTNSYYTVAINIDGKLKHIGTFKDEKKAALKYNEVALKHHGEFARLNVID